jgi:hypothetical protein
MHIYRGEPRPHHVSQPLKKLRIPRDVVWVYLNAVEAPKKNASAEGKVHASVEGTAKGDKINIMKKLIQMENNVIFYYDKKASTHVVRLHDDTRFKQWIYISKTLHSCNQIWLYVVISQN